MGGSDSWKPKWTANVSLPDIVAIPEKRTDAKQSHKKGKRNFDVAGKDTDTYNFLILLLLLHWHIQHVFFFFFIRSPDRH